MSGKVENEGDETVRSDTCVGYARAELMLNPVLVTVKLRVVARIPDNLTVNISVANK